MDVSPSDIGLPVKVHLVGVDENKKSEQILPLFLLWLLTLNLCRIVFRVVVWSNVGTLLRHSIFTVNKTKFSFP